MIYGIIDGTIEVGSTVKLRPELKEEGKELESRLGWIKTKKLSFKSKYKVKEIHLVHLPHGKPHFVVKLTNGIAEFMSWFIRVKNRTQARKITRPVFYVLISFFFSCKFLDKTSIMQLHTTIIVKNNKYYSFNNYYGWW